MALANAMTSDSASRVTHSSRGLCGLLLALACIAGTMVARAQDAPPASQSPSEQSSPAQEAPASDEPAGAPADEEIKFPDAPDPGAPGTPPAAKKPQAPPPADAPEDANADADAPEEKSSAEEEEPPPDAAPRTPGVVGPTPEHFEPTEKVRADFDVSFPVDI
jgi:hypothetical protein